MRVEDVYVQNPRLWVDQREKGGKAVALPCHHNLEVYLLHAYLDGTVAWLCWRECGCAGLRPFNRNRQGWLDISAMASRREDRTHPARDWLPR